MNDDLKDFLHYAEREDARSYRRRLTWTEAKTTLQALPRLLLTALLLGVASSFLSLAVPLNFPPAFITAAVLTGFSAAYFYYRSHPPSPRIFDYDFRLFIFLLFAAGFSAFLIHPLLGSLSLSFR